MSSLKKYFEDEIIKAIDDFDVNPRVSVSLKKDVFYSDFYDPNITLIIIVDFYNNGSRYKFAYRNSGRDIKDYLKDSIGYIRSRLNFELNRLSLENKN